MRIDIASSLIMAATLATAIIGRAALTADWDGDREAAAVQGAKVSLTQAIATAEQQTGAQAFDAGVNMKGGQTRIAVETNSPKGVQTVTIDARSGQVVGTHAGGEQD